MKAAFIFLLVGYGTKAGLAPMHSWLPDAHSQAPAPVSGLMSGVLLSVAFYAILRVQSLADAVVGGDLLRWLLAAGGLLSLAVPALLLLRQRDYKRMLAYSSVEHMGLMALGAAAGGVLGLSAVLLHMLGHGLAKSTLFVVSGRMLAVEGTSVVAEVHGLLARRPGLAAPFLVGMAALLGFPPFSLFFSEVGIFVALWQQGLGWVGAAGLVLLLVVFAGLTRLTASMMLGPADQPGHPPNRSWHGPSLPLLLALTATAVVAFLGSPLSDVLVRSAELLAGGS
jgi:hydrogenase-4 component F